MLILSCNSSPKNVILNNPFYTDSINVTNVNIKYLQDEVINRYFSRDYYTGNIEYLENGIQAEYYTRVLGALGLKKYTSIMKIKIIDGICIFTCVSLENNIELFEQEIKPDVSYFINKIKENIQYEENRLRDAKKLEENRLMKEREKEKEREELNKLAEEAKNMLAEKANISREFDSPILILRCKSSLPNSAGGVNVDIFFQNISNRRIKYIYFTVTPYNKVDDIVRSEIGGKSNVVLEQVGYIEPERFSKDYEVWGNVWYNSTISYIKIVKIEIVFDDNSKKIIENKDIIDKIILSQEEYSFWNRNFYRDGR
jgi:hypothetical protein